MRIISSSDVTCIYLVISHNTVVSSHADEATAMLAAEHTGDVDAQVQVLRVSR